MKKVFTLENIKVYTDDSGDESQRMFSGYASTFNNTDRVGDVVEAGAFTKSLLDHKRERSMPAMLLHHDMHRPIGKWTAIEEDSKGLHVSGTLTKGVRDADEAYALLQDGALHSLSIGYMVNDEEWDSKSKTNRLKEISLHEISLVTIPANAQATIAQVKDAEGEVNIRELERVLREAGLSRKESKAVLADGFKALKEPTELPEPEITACDALAESERLKAMLFRLSPYAKGRTSSN